MREDYANKNYLAVESLAKRESLPLPQLIAWCESSTIEARRVGDHWFVNPDDWFAKKETLSTTTHPSLHSSLPLLIGVLLFISLIVSTPFTNRFHEGSRVVMTTVATIVNGTFEVETRTAVASVYDLLWIRLDRLWLITGEFFNTLASNLQYFWHQALNSWRQFIGSETSENPSLPTLDPTMLEALKNEIKAELLRDLGQQANPQNNSPNAPGLVVLPSTGNPQSDEALKLDLKNTFSDRVEVQFDQSGQAGVITPIFRRGRGDNYIFILTPIKQN